MHPLCSVLRLTVHRPATHRWMTRQPAPPPPPPRRPLPRAAGRFASFLSSCWPEMWSVCCGGTAADFSWPPSTRPTWQSSAWRPDRPSSATTAPPPCWRRWMKQSRCGAEASGGQYTALPIFCYSSAGSRCSRCNHTLCGSNYTFVY